ncbi:MAG: amidohydrolase family protein, partial [Clostridia bacterium]|nr:amidohydrolase family protein [Clostridia bacterium]
MYDIRIENGLVINGTGSPALAAQVAIQNGKIVKIARQIPGEAKQVIDAAGQVITPGFIDSHSHSDKQFFTCPLQTEKIEQGITTSIAGQCGGSLCGEDAPAFFDQNRNAALGANMALLIGHGTLRKAVVGTEDREPTPQELDRMKDLMRRAMERGALGISFGLIYAPGCFAKTQELIALAQVVGEYRGIAAIHLRNEGDELLPAVQEFITVVRESGVRGILSHHKAYGQNNWGKVRTSLELIEQANQDGVELFLDVYPYTASHTTFSSPILPTEWRSGGTEALVKRVNDPVLAEQLRKDFYQKHDDLSWILVTACPGSPEYSGLTVSQVAQLRGQDEF